MSSKATEARLKRLYALAADTSEPDMSDHPEQPTEAWASAEVGKFFRPRKEIITIRVDADVLEWFRRSASDGSGYQTAMNAALRKHMASARR